jgi:anti-sigma-K factor RskA
LDALDRAERLEFEAHLAECATCRDEVQAFREVSGLLAPVAPAAAAPPGLRERIVRDAKEVRPIAARRPLVPWIVAEASVALTLVTGNSYRQERDAARAVRTALARAEDSLASRDSVIGTLLSPDVRTARLAATGQPPSARLFWIPSRHRLVMAAYRLPPAPAGRTYQLWAIAKSKPVSLGTFNTAPDGTLRTVMGVPAELAFEVAAVTEEPAGGSPQPTQQPFLVGNVVWGD